MKEALYKTLHCTVEDVSLCGVLDFGFFHHKREEVELHRHTQPELHVCIKGRYRLESITGDRFVEMQAGGAVLVPGGYWHNGLVLGEEAEEYTLRLELAKTKDEKGKKPIFSDLEASLFGNEKEMLPLALPNALSLLAAIEEGLSDTALGARETAEASFRLLSVGLLRAILFANAENEKKDDSRDDTIDRKESIERLLQQQYANPSLSLEQVSEHLGFSPRQVNRLFLQFYGQSFRDTLAEVRLYNAQRLLLRTSLPMAEVALRVGYREPSGFYTAFRKRFGCSPRQYRVAAVKSEQP